jgi:hypothetical protein
VTPRQPLVVDRGDASVLLSQLLSSVAGDRHHTLIRVSAHHGPAARAEGSNPVQAALASEVVAVNAV